MRGFAGSLVVRCSHVHHHSAFTGDFYVPKDVGNACHRIAHPARKRQEAFEVLIALEWRLKDEADDRQYLFLSSV